MGLRQYSFLFKSCPCLLHTRFVNSEGERLVQLEQREEVGKGGLGMSQRPCGEKDHTEDKGDAPTEEVVRLHMVSAPL